MTTRQITDIRVGNTAKSALYKGTELLWKKSSGQIFQPERLISFYDRKNFSQGVWTDSVTGDTVSLPSALISSYNTTFAPEGVLLKNDSLFLPLDESLPEKSVCVRFRVACSSYKSNIIIRFLSQFTRGITVTYKNGRVFAATHNGSVSTNISTADIPVNPHDYNNYEFTSSGSTVSMFVNGKFIISHTINGVVSRLELTSGINTYELANIVESALTYSCAHTEAEAAAVSDSLLNRYPLPEIVPPSEGVMLYDSGNQCTETTGGWNLNTTTNYSTVITELRDDCIALNGINEPYYYACAKTRSFIDLTPYTKAYFLISSTVFPGELKNFSDCMGTQFGFSSTDNVYAATTRITMVPFTTASMCGKLGNSIDDAELFCYDISNINTKKTVAVVDGSGKTDGTFAAVYKIWLA